jgi:hypothetical protein
MPERSRNIQFALVWALAGTACLPSRLALAQPCSVALSHTFAEGSQEEHRILRFDSYRVKLAQFPQAVGQQIQRAMEMSILPSNTSREVGFFVVVTRDGQWHIGECYTSNLSGFLIERDGYAILDPFLARFDRNEIARIESYHTHPPDAGYMPLMLSPDDVSSAMRMQKRIRFRWSIDVPFAEHAISMQNSWGSSYGDANRIEFSPHEVVTARSQIAQNLKATRRKIALPEKAVSSALAQQSEIRPIPLANEERRAALDRAIERAYGQSKSDSYGKFQELSSKRLAQLGFLQPIKDANRNAIAVPSTAAVALSIGIHGDVPNSFKYLVDMHLQGILQASKPLLTPEPGTLLVYANETSVMGLAVYRGQSPNGTWRVDRTFNALWTTYEHDWDDVPADWGDRVYLLKVPPLDELVRLLNVPVPNE